MIKNFLLGFGCALILFAAVTYFYYDANAENLNSQNNGAEEINGDISDEIIIERARELGMLFYMDFIRAGGDKEPDPQIKEVVVYETVKEELSDMELIERAAAIAMDYFDVVQALFPVSPESVINLAPMFDEDEYDEYDEYDYHDDIPDEIIFGEPLDISEEESIAIAVPYGTNATVIAAALQENGVIANADDFIDFLNEIHMAGRLLSGTHIFKEGMDYEQILYVLRGNRSR